MNRAKRIDLAQQSLKIIKDGHYFFDSKQIDVHALVDFTMEHSFSIAPEAWETILKKAETMAPKAAQTQIEVRNCTSTEALLAAEQGAKIAILNFASAKNPGGGFLGGALAQEECLARSSALYPSQIKHQRMYDYNRAHNTYLYSDYMIYSPAVAFWMDDDGQFLETPHLADIITAPAPNRAAMLQNHRPQEEAQIETVFQARMEKVLALAQTQGVEQLILGAWGCGVFRNKPETVARLFKETIDTKFQGVFTKITFAVLDHTPKKLNIQAFERVFG